MSATGRGPIWVPVRIDEAVWLEEVGRLNRTSAARIAAERERRRLEEQGVELSQLQHTDEVGTDGTSLPGLRKVYVPITAEAASTRPFAFVFAPVRRDGHTFLRLIAFGERHPPRGSGSVYERAHKRLHGRYPDQ